MTKLRKATATLTPLAPSPAPAVAGLPRWVLITGALVAALASAGAAVAQTDVSGSNTVSVDQVQHNLSIDQDRIGDAQRAQGDLSAALKSYQASMEIRRKLAERDPGNAQWQTDLAFSCWKLSQLDTPALPKAERRALLKRGLAVLERLQQRGRLTPDKQTWPEMFRQALQKLAP